MNKVSLKEDYVFDMQKFDRLTNITLSSEYTYRVGYAAPRTYSMIPEIIRAESASISPSVVAFDGEWAVTAKPKNAKATLRYQVASFGKPIPKVPVTLMDSNWNILGTRRTDENGLVEFDVEFNRPGGYVFNAVIGEGRVRPLTYMSPRVSRIFVKVWLIKVEQVDSTDVWLRWVGRSILEPLPHDFWRVQPKTVIGLAIPKESKSYYMLVPVVSGVTLTLELGVSAVCNTPTAYPPPDVCCEYAKGTWWWYKLYAKSSNDSDWKEVGGDKINLDYHLKYSVTTDSVTYKGRCLKLMENGKVRCEWEKDTAPTC